MRGSVLVDLSSRCRQDILVLVSLLILEHRSALSRPLEAEINCSSSSSESLTVRSIYTLVISLYGEFGSIVLLAWVVSEFLWWPGGEGDWCWVCFPGHYSLVPDIFFGVFDKILLPFVYFCTVNAIIVYS